MTRINNAIEVSQEWSLLHAIVSHILTADFPKQNFFLGGISFTFIFGCSAAESIVFTQNKPTPSYSKVL